MAYFPITTNLNSGDYADIMGCGYDDVGEFEDSHFRPIITHPNLDIGTIVSISNPSNNIKTQAMVVGQSQKIAMSPRVGDLLRLNRDQLKRCEATVEIEVEASQRLIPASNYGSEFLITGLCLILIFVIIGVLAIK